MTKKNREKGLRGREVLDIPKSGKLVRTLSENQIEEQFVYEGIGKSPSLGDDSAVFTIRDADRNVKMLRRYGL